MVVTSTEFHSGVLKFQVQPVQNIFLFMESALRRVAGRTVEEEFLNYRTERRSRQGIQEVGLSHSVRSKFPSES